MLGSPNECASARCSRSDIEVRDETAERVENTDEAEEIEVRDDSDDCDASDDEEDGVDTVEDGWSSATGFLDCGACSESESESIFRFIESSGSVPNRVCCSGVK